MRSFAQFSLHLFLSIFGRALLHERFSAVKYDCSSYFLELDVERLRSVVSRQYSLNRACSESTHIHVVSLNQHRKWCTVVYEFIPNQKAIELNPLCNATAQDITNNAISSTFGFHWGCPQLRFPIPITSYYSVALHVHEEETTGVSVTHETKCVVHSLNFEANTTVDCLMNEYGGYGWSEPDPNDHCRLEEFEDISVELIDLLRESILFCSYRMFLYIGYLNSHKYDHPAKTASEVVNALSRECQNPPAWIFNSMYFDFLNLMDLLLYVYCSDRWYAANANESFPVVFELLNIFDATLTNHYDKRKQLLFHRSRMFHVHSIPSEELQSTQVTCGKQFNVTIVKAYFPVTIACTEHLYALEENDLFEMFLTVGFLKIQPESDRDFEVVIYYNLPEFHHPGEYLCARYEYFAAISKSSFGGCNLETVSKDTVSCRCLSPGYYALLQDAPLNGDIEGRILNFLDKPTTRFVHAVVVVVLSISIVLYGTVLWSRRALNLYCRNQMRKEKAFLQLTFEIQALLVARTIVQLHAISVMWKNDCLIPGPVQHVLHLLLNVFNVLSGTVVFIANTAYRIHSIRWKISLALYILAITAGILLYLFYGTHYNQLNCLPDEFMFGMVYPSVALNILALVFLSLFWCVRPYRNIDEWFGILLSVVMSLYLWVQFVLINVDKHTFRMCVVRLTTLTLIHAVVCSVYHCLIKWSMILWYWRLSKAVYLSLLSKRAEEKSGTFSESEHRQNATPIERSEDLTAQRPSIS